MRRSYTLAYIILGDLILAIWIGFAGPSEIISTINGISAFALPAAALSITFLVRAHWLFFQKEALTRVECWVSAAIGLFIPAVWWIAFSALLGLFGADMFDA